VDILDRFNEFEFSEMEDLMEEALVFLDDLGAETDKKSKSACGKLCQVLSHRERKFTVITTNTAPDTWAEAFDSRVADRLVRNTELVDMFRIPSYSEVCAKAR